MKIKTQIIINLVGVIFSCLWCGPSWAAFFIAINAFLLGGNFTMWLFAHEKPPT